MSKDKGLKVNFKPIKIGYKRSIIKAGYEFIDKRQTNA
jgi:hypothetical protein